MDRRGEGARTRCPLVETRKRMRDDGPATIRIDGGSRRRCRLEVPALELRVLEGADAGSVFTSPLPLLRIGTGAGSDITLTDRSVSRCHAELRVTSEGLRIRDLDSTNGTFVEGIRVTDASVPDGAVCGFGATRLRVSLARQLRVAPIGEEARFGRLVGASPAMRDLYGLLRAVAPSPVTVLVTGETGTGKELIAREIHERSARSGPFVIFDAGVADPEMVRADLFGHEKGAFTGAVAARKGAFREAQGGTLFLDEIGELPLELQPRLLRALEAREVAPLGSDRHVPIDVRVVAATHRDLSEMVDAGAFREDLYHRLSVVPVHVPPLRDRTGDLPALVTHLASDRVPRLSPEAWERLANHDWPGNVRALRNLVERWAVLHPRREISVEDLGLPTRRVGGQEAPGSAHSPGAYATPQAARTMEEVEREAIELALKRFGGNQRQAAEELGMSLSTLKRRLRKYRREAP
jgi:DNA-binding NtrC family response regulator